jgi:hypothetical protein
MFPDLFAATHAYWQALDQIEADYKQGKLSAQEVDEKVKILMRELGSQRRAALSAFWSSLQEWSLTHSSQLVGVATMAIAIYLWWQWQGTIMP